jgi:PAS domain S-box-containing protein
MSKADLIESLQTHRVELEIQHEDLSRTHEILVSAYEQYTELYHTAPIGFFTLAQQAVVLAVNQTGADLLAAGVDGLIGRKFTQYIAPESQDIFYFHLNQARTAETRQSCELQLVRSDGVYRFAQLESRTAKTGSNADSQIQMAVIDITTRKEAELEQQQLLAELADRNEQLQTLGARLVNVQETERHNLARELHDRVGQNLTALSFYLDRLQSELADDDPATARQRTQLQEAMDLVEKTSELTRDVMAELRPAGLDEYGLVRALTGYTTRFSRRTELPVDLQGDLLDLRLPAAVESALFRIAQEALTNIAKHAQAGQVTIRIEIDEQIVRLMIADDGVGFEPDQALAATQPDHWGLGTMTERAEFVGGRCRIESAPGRGTRIIVEVPYP